MPAMEGFVDFDPDENIPSLKGKVIFITGGTAGLGASSIKALAAHNPAHIYFSGRNAHAGQNVISEIKCSHPSASLTFIQMDLSSLSSVKAASNQFIHDHLDILMCNAGIMAHPPALSKDGYEIHIAVNHLGHEMLIKQLLPTLLRTAELPDSDVRIINLTSIGYRGHPRSGISFNELSTTTSKLIMGPWMRYGQSKLANILYASALARHHPSVTSVSVHPGVVETGLVTNLSFLRRTAIYVINWFMGIEIMDEKKGEYSQLWCAAGAKKGELVNGGFYIPVGVERTSTLDKKGRSEGLGERVWEWTEGVLGKH
ncbi:oxidoreductase [Zopfia rhizophila CBS 207.26]|uniref:Oxidoreductase n=1 Tax=Zopfia rhizophila CBS 207.26 TaxID=1314779 RepID=A0A6A6EE05_9PEZI|nr:oxidoreductase [Zopfia rhizophila CBS 207.26]